jgi:hypothetical protein
MPSIFNLLIALLLPLTAMAFSSRITASRRQQLSMQLNANDASISLKKALATGMIAAGTFFSSGNFAMADETIEKVPLYNKKSTDVQAYADVNRGFKLLRSDSSFLSSRRALVLHFHLSKLPGPLVTMNSRAPAEATQ